MYQFGWIFIWEAAYLVLAATAKQCPNLHSHHYVSSSCSIFLATLGIISAFNLSYSVWWVWNGISLWFDFHCISCLTNEIEYPLMWSLVTSMALSFNFERGERETGRGLLSMKVCDWLLGVRRFGRGTSATGGQSKGESGDEGFSVHGVTVTGEAMRCWCRWRAGFGSGTY